jgi:hypothetical protein
MRKQFFLLALVSFLFSYTRAQFADSLHILVGTTATVASAEYQPLWIIANRYGTVTNQQADLTSRILISNKHLFSQKNKPGADSIYPHSYINYAVDLYNNDHFENTFLQEAFVKAGIKSWELRAGRYEEVIGEVDPFLSSGSLAVSSNALPIPKIGIANTRYAPIPYTNGWVQFKGRFSHGWLGETNYLKDAFLHEKSLYLRFGKKKFAVHTGLNHFAQWGGTHPSGKAPSRFKDYLQIIAGGKGDASDPVYQQGPVDIANAVGNHLITSDIGFSLQRNSSVFKIYTQTIFEKGKGRGPDQRDRIVGLKVTSRDRLIGFSWENIKQSFLEKIVVEGLFTRHQGGPVLYVGQDNYYNNATYKTGWTYQDKIIGTPLFIIRNDALKFHPALDSTQISSWNITSNRVNGVHLGIKGTINKQLVYRMLTTYVQHYGNYNNTHIFTPFKKQLHFLLEGSYQVNNRINIGMGLAQDVGDISDNTGGSLRIEWLLK